MRWSFQISKSTNIIPLDKLEWIDPLIKTSFLWIRWNKTLFMPCDRYACAYVTVNFSPTETAVSYTAPGSRTGIAKLVLQQAALKSERWKILPRRIMAGKVWRCSQALPTDREWMLYGLPHSLPRRGSVVFPSFLRRYHHIAAPRFAFSTRRKKAGRATCCNRAYRIFIWIRWCQSRRSRKPQVIETIKKSAYIAPEIAMRSVLQKGGTRNEQSWTARYRRRSLHEALTPTK